MVLSIRHASRHLLVEGRQVPHDVFLLHLPNLPLLLCAPLLILDLVLQVLIVAQRVLPVLLSLLVLEFFHLLNIELEPSD